MKAGMATSPIATMMTEQYHLVLAALIMARALLKIRPPARFGIPVTLVPFALSTTRGGLPFSANLYPRL
jgi:hypothetical protein